MRSGTRCQVHAPSGRVGRSGSACCRVAPACCALSPTQARPPVPKEPDHLAESGRGLDVVDTLSDEWGYTTAIDMGKVVWATFSTEAGPAARALTPAPRCSSAPHRPVWR